MGDGFGLMRVPTNVKFELLKNKLICVEELNHDCKNNHQGGILMSYASPLSYPISGRDIESKYKHLIGECLQDISQSGRSRPWRVNKQTTEKLAECYAYLGLENKAFSVSRCASYLDFQRCAVDRKHHSKLLNANFCRDRMCSQCQWRKSIRQFSVAVKVGHELRIREQELNQPESKFIFLTLTIPNVRLEKLSDSITELFTGWKKLRQRKEVRKVVLGYHRALEITYNAQTNEFHPHIHAAIVVSSNYFSGHNYIKHERWLEMWREAMRMPEITQVDVRKIRAKKGQDEITSGFAEACKYSLKYWATSLTKEEKKEIRRKVDNEGIDFGVKGHIWLRETLEESAHVVHELSSALRNRRLVQFGGVLRDIKRELKLKDAEEGGDLVNTSDEKTECDCPVCGAKTIRELYHWFSDIRDYIS